MGSLLSIFAVLVRSERQQVRTAIDAAEEALVEAVHDVADCADEMVAEL